jgi:ATP-dependent DNA helicase RecQ
VKFRFPFFKNRTSPPEKGPLTVEAFLRSWLLLDIEARKEHVYHLGALLGEATFERQGRFKAREALEALDAFGKDAEAVLGHNILEHDLPILRGISPRLRLLQKLAVDTLFLSPLAFPENPYHRLVKDYKLLKDAVNDPVADARLAASVFRDQWASFQTFGRTDSALSRKSV